MDYRIEVSPKLRWRDARGEGVKKQIVDFLGIPVEKVLTRDVYTVSADISADEARSVAELLVNPVLQSYRLDGVAAADFEELPRCGYLIVVGFKPGVTDNVGRTAKAAIGDIIGRRLRDDEDVFSSTEYLLYGDALKEEDAERIGRKLLANELIQSVAVLTGEQAEKGIPANLPRVNGSAGGEVRLYDLEVSDEKLVEISRKGILALTLEEMKSIQNYFRSCAGARKARGLSAQPTDVEMEVLAQTWSEHCKHKIFSANIDYLDAETGEKRRIESCYKTFIKAGTRELAGEVDYLVSVFVDNAGVIAFNDKLDLVYKVETHNSPSALDPYGGAMTGIVGVNRDPMGTGQGANLLINVWGYCLGSPFSDDSEVPEGLLHPRRLRDGIHKGVIDGGNQSGIPYGYGWEYFDERYLGKPLVYCGTVGTLPKTVNGRKGSEKSIEPGDLIVMAGGRIGKDGIHGATFSSEELHKDSPVQAVQIGDPITQKKLSDFLYEARERGLYRFVTDNGAGGLSSSVGEMAEQCGGCRMDLAKAPLKYAGLQPWEILISEAQERMSFAVPPEKIAEFSGLARRREVEISVLGEFTDDGKFEMLYNGKTVCSLDIKFMHEGLPKLNLKAVWKKPSFPEPDYSRRSLASDLPAMLARLNICSDEYKARQYDHEVKGLSVVKPFVGRGRDVASDATVTMIEPLSAEGVVLSAGILPRYSDIDTYWMTASVIDLSIRRMVAVGAGLDVIAGLDNFCWPDPVKSEKTPDGEYKLAQLVRANQALYDFTKAFKIPCISGKDSMKNDSTRGGRKISIPPSLLFSAIGKMEDVSAAVTLDAKKPGDLVYVIGETFPELGGSEYFAMLGFTGNNVPKVDAEKAKRLYNAVAEGSRRGLWASLAAPALGGLAVAFAKIAMAGRLGLSVDVSRIPGAEKLDALTALFSESNSRLVATVSPENRAAVETLLENVPHAEVGVVTGADKLILGGEVFRLDDLLSAYKSTLAEI